MPLCLIPNLRIARPKNFFDTQLTLNYMGWLIQATNCRAVADGAGSGMYVDFVPFDLPKLFKFIGLLFTDGLTPKSQFEYWFEGQEGEPLFGNNKYARAIDKHVGKGHKVSKKRCCKYFQGYFTLLDFHDNPKESQQANPLWNVEGSNTF
jgi:hypothetical protein